MKMAAERGAMAVTASEQYNTGRVGRVWMTGRVWVTGQATLCRCWQRANPECPWSTCVSCPEPKTSVPAALLLHSQRWWQEAWGGAPWERVMSLTTSWLRKGVVAINHLLKQKITLTLFKTQPMIQKLLECLTNSKDFKYSFKHLVSFLIIHVN